MPTTSSNSWEKLLTEIGQTSASLSDLDIGGGDIRYDANVPLNSQPLTHAISSSKAHDIAALAAKRHALQKRRVLLSRALMMQDKDEILERRQTNACRPVLSIPTETLLKALAYVRDDDDHVFRPLDLASVCHQWYAVVLGDAGAPLWTRIVLPLSIPEAFYAPTYLSARLFLRRSRSLALSLLIRGNADSRWGPDPILALIASCAERCESLSLPLPLFTSLLPIDHRFPVIRHLEFTYGASTESQVYPDSIFSISPPRTLRTLRFSAPELRNAIPSLLTSNAAGQTCSVMNIPPGYSSQMAQELLQALPNVKSLECSQLKGGWSAVSPPPSVQRLSIVAPGALYGAHCRGAPNVQHLSLRYVKDSQPSVGVLGAVSYVREEPTSRLVEFSDLVSLVLHSCPSDILSAEVPALLAQTQNLRSIACVGTVGALSGAFGGIQRYCVTAPSWVASAHTSDEGEGQGPAHGAKLLFMSAIDPFKAETEGDKDTPETQADFIRELGALVMMRDLQERVFPVPFRIRFHPSLASKVAGIERLVLEYPELLEIGVQPPESFVAPLSSEGYTLSVE